MTVLFGFPGAGAGKNVFEIWQTSLGSEIVFHEVLYSGRMFQPGCKDMKEAAERCAQQVRGAVREDDDIYFFGHCMGAAVAYETAKYLQVHCDMHIRGLFISAFISPDVPIEDGISHWDDQEFAEEIRSHGTFPEEFFVKPELLKLFLPRIRADYRMIEEYCDREHVVLDCPFAGFFGKDDPSVTEAGIIGWKNYTTRGFLKFMFPGKHYFYYDHQEEIIAKIRELIEVFRREETGRKEKEEMEKLIKKVLAETMELDPEHTVWNSDTDIVNEIGVDSLQLVRFLLKMEEELNITIDYDALTFEDLQTIGSLAAFLSRCTGSQQK